MNSHRYKCLQIFVYILTILLIVSVITFYIYQWHQGKEAEKNATNFLQYYEQQDEPEVDINNEPEDVINTMGYTLFGVLYIEKIDLRIPIIKEISPSSLSVSICYYSGPEPGNNGNLVLAGHNYRNGAHFGKLKDLSIGDAVSIKDISGDIFNYTVYEIEIIDEDDIYLLENKREKEMTLLTCVTNASKRLLVRCDLTN